MDTHKFISLAGRSSLCAKTQARLLRDLRNSFRTLQLCPAFVPDGGHVPHFAVVYAGMGLCSGSRDGILGVPFPYQNDGGFYENNVCGQEGTVARMVHAGAD